MDMVHPAERTARSKEKASRQQHESASWCDRRTEISELLALVARSLRPIYLIERDPEFDDLLEAIDRRSTQP